MTVNALLKLPEQKFEQFRSFWPRGAARMLKAVAGETRKGRRDKAHMFVGYVGLPLRNFQRHRL